MLDEAARRRGTGWRVGSSWPPPEDRDVERVVDGINNDNQCPRKEPNGRVSASLGDACHLDAVAGTITQFASPTASHVARSVAEVRGVIDAAHTAARRGRYAVGFVAYEAAPAFDPAMAVRDVPAGTPLAWFVEYADRTIRPWTPHDRAPWRGAVRRRGGSEWFVEAVDDIRRRIEAGDVYQVNLTDRCDLGAQDDPVDLGAVFEQLVAAQRSASNWWMDFGEITVAAASPELFFRVEDQIATTRPMKGTARRGTRADDDEQRAVELRHSPKELAENLMIVDLLRNDLSRVATLGGVTVPHLFDLERYPTVWQMTSTVQARLRDDVALIDIFDALFPCGSVTGAPKVAAMSVIDALEPWPRGVYCGAVGVIEPGDGLTCSFDVAIRTAVANGSTGAVTYGSGGGITWDSRPADEDAELIAKTEVLTASVADIELLETLLVDGARARHLDRHLARLAASARYFGYDAPVAAIESAVLDLPPARKPMRVRIVVDRHGDFRVETQPLGCQPDRVRLAVGVVPMASDDPMRCHKVTDRSFYDDALARSPDADDVVLVNERGEVVETCTASLLYRFEGVWWTPPLTSGGLDGIGRRVLVEDGVVGERVLRATDLFRCDELAVVSSLRGRRRATLIDTERSR